MNYLQAKQYKADLGLVEFLQMHYQFKVFVTPSDQDDFAWYLEEIRSDWSQLTDETAKQYSYNGDFDVKALHFDGVNIIYKSV